MAWRSQLLSIILSIFVLNGLGVSHAMAEKMEPVHPEALVDAQWLKKHAQEAHVVVLDASDVQDDTYEPKSLKDAVGMPYRDLRQNSGLMKGISYGLEKEDFDPSSLERMFQKAGVSKDSTVAVVAQHRVDDAAMVFWALKWLGHEDVRLLPVSYLKAVHESLLTSDLQHWSDQEVTGNFTAQPDWSWYATRDDVLEAMQTPDTVIWDVRPSAYFQGEETKTIRGGTLATAKNWPFQEVWTDAAMSRVDWESIERHLAQMFPNEAGQAKQDRTVISFCNSGHAAGSGFYAWQCGYSWALCDASWNVMAYDGSMPVKNLNLYIQPE